MYWCQLWLHKLPVFVMIDSLPPSLLRADTVSDSGRGGGRSGAGGDCAAGGQPTLLPGPQETSWRESG